MAFPFPSPFKVPLPRRFILLALGAALLVVFLNLFAPSALPPLLSDSSSEDGYFSAGKWLPNLWDSDDILDRPPEFDEDGQCLFLSPYDALSPEEKRRAELMVLEEVSAGVVRAVDTSDDAAAVDENDDRPRGPSHPILALLKAGEEKWKKKTSSQSRTIEEAVEKYIAKWNRNPPKGYDKWWKFASSVHVLLPDEYDAIMNSLMPFYGLPIKTLQERLVEAETIPETFTLIVHDGKVELEWNDNYSRDTWWASRPRADSQINLMEPFLADLPSFRATFTIHDQPTMLLDYARQQELLKAAKAGTVSNHPNEDDRFEQVWARACAPDSPLVKGEKELPETDTFISRHEAAMDICQHPSYMDNHGMLLEAHDENMHPKPHTKLYPILVPSKTSLNGDIPVTPIGRDGRRDDVGYDPDWSKKQGKVYWRGLATGLNHNKKSGARWRESHRERLHFLANDKTNANQEVLSAIGNTGRVEYNRYPMKELGSYYMDMKLAGGNWQCDGDDGTCAEMDREIEWADKDPGEKSNEYKYVFDTDGNAWSSRFPRLMASNNVVIKASVFPEWNTQSLPEWYVYVPSKVDYSDLYSIMAFFRGTPSGKGNRGGHDEVARRIALNSQCWVEKTWRREDMQSYMFLLYLEYARLVSPDRDNGKQDFILPKKHHPAPATPPAAAAPHHEEPAAPAAAPDPAPADELPEPITITEVTEEESEREEKEHLDEMMRIEEMIEDRE